MKYCIIIINNRKQLLLLPEAKDEEKALTGMTTVQTSNQETLFITTNLSTIATAKEKQQLFLNPDHPIQLTEDSTLKENYLKSTVRCMAVGRDSGGYELLAQEFLHGHNAHWLARKPNGITSVALANQNINLQLSTAAINSREYDNQPIAAWDDQHVILYVVDVYARTRTKKPSYPTAQTDLQFIQSDLQAIRQHNPKTPINVVLVKNRESYKENQSLDTTSLIKDKVTSLHMENIYLWDVKENENSSLHPTQVLHAPDVSAVFEQTAIQGAALLEKENAQSAKKSVSVVTEDSTSNSNNNLHQDTNKVNTVPETTSNNNQPKKSKSILVVDRNKSGLNGEDFASSYVFANTYKPGKNAYDMDVFHPYHAKFTPKPTVVNRQSVLLTISSTTISPEKEEQLPIKSWPEDVVIYTVNTSHRVLKNTNPNSEQLLQDIKNDIHAIHFMNPNTPIIVVGLNRGDKRNTASASKDAVPFDEATQILKGIVETEFNGFATYQAADITTHANPIQEVITPIFETAAQKALGSASDNSKINVHTPTVNTIKKEIERLDHWYRWNGRSKAQEIRSALADAEDAAQHGQCQNINSFLNYKSPKKNSTEPDKKSVNEALAIHRIWESKKETDASAELTKTLNTLPKFTQ